MFSLSNLLKFVLSVLGAAVCTGCIGIGRADQENRLPQTFYTVTAEIALARGEPRVAALQYAVAAADDTDVAVLQRAVDVAAQTLQPSLAARAAARWIDVEPRSVEAQRAAAKAALALHKIDESAAHYRIVLASSPRGADAELVALESELADQQDIFASRGLADRIVGFYPQSAAALRMQGTQSLRAGDPAAAVRSFQLALSALDTASAEAGGDREELLQSLWRARIMDGQMDEPLTESQARLMREPTTAHRLGHALLLLAAQRNSAALEELEVLSQQKDAEAVALRLIALIEFQEGRFDAAAARFAELLATGKFADDAFYYLGLIAERRQDLERALRLYAQVQGGENALPALIRATAILRAHGAAPEAEELLDRLESEEAQRVPEILAARARMYADAGEGRQALAVLTAGLEEYPDSVELRYAIASTYEEQGRVGPALRELRRVLKLRPDDPAALNALGFTLADHHRQLKSARRLVEQAHAAAPKNAAILDSLGWVLYREGNSPGALGYLTQAYFDDRGGDIAAHLGEVLWQLGQQTEAERIWSDAGVIETDNRLLKETRLRLHGGK